MKHEWYPAYLESTTIPSDRSEALKIVTVVFWVCRRCGRVERVLAGQIPSTEECRGDVP